MVRYRQYYILLTTPQYLLCIPGFLNAAEFVLLTSVVCMKHMALKKLKILYTQCKQLSYSCQKVFINGYCYGRIFLNRDLWEPALFSVFK